MIGNMSFGEDWSLEDEFKDWSDKDIQTLNDIKSFYRRSPSLSAALRSYEDWDSVESVMFWLDELSSTVVECCVFLRGKMGDVSAGESFRFGAPFEAMWEEFEHLLESLAFVQTAAGFNNGKSPFQTPEKWEQFYPYLERFYLSIVDTSLRVPFENYCYKIVAKLQYSTLDIHLQELFGWSSEKSDRMLERSEELVFLEEIGGRRLFDWDGTKRSFALFVKALHEIGLLRGRRNQIAWAKWESIATYQGEPVKGLKDAIKNKTEASRVKFEAEEERMKSVVSKVYDEVRKK